MHEKPLNILMVLHMPWTRDLGGSRVQFELAEHFVKLGHSVSKYDINDAIPRYLRSAVHLPRLGRLARLLMPKFCIKATAHVAKHSKDYDIIDAHHGDLPIRPFATRSANRWICRSVGLVPLYNLHSASASAPMNRHRTSRLKTAIERLEERRRISNHDASSSMHTADAIIVPTRFEAEYIHRNYGATAEVSIIPFGLPLETLAKFKAASHLGGQLHQSTIAFVGTWDKRKGSEDWPKIIRSVRSAAPEARFIFLGSHADESKIRVCLAPDDRDFVRVIPKFESSQLPNLLSTASLGAFPSYLEGFPYGVLEMISAGLPVVAYDIAGPADMIPNSKLGELVPVGNVEEFASAILRRLSRSAAEAQAESQVCIEHAARFNLPNTAEQTLALYRTTLSVTLNPCTLPSA